MRAKTSSAFFTTSLLTDCAGFSAPARGFRVVSARYKGGPTQQPGLLVQTVAVGQLSDVVAQPVAHGACRQQLIVVGEYGIGWCAVGRSMANTHRMLWGSSVVYAPRRALVMRPTVAVVAVSPVVHVRPSKSHNTGPANTGREAPAPAS